MIQWQHNERSQLLTLQLTVTTGSLLFHRFEAAEQITPQRVQRRHSWPVVGVERLNTLFTSNANHTNNVSLLHTQSSFTKCDKYKSLLQKCYGNCTWGCWWQTVIISVNPRSTSSNFSDLFHLEKMMAEGWIFLRAISKHNARRIREAIFSQLLQKKSRHRFFPRKKMCFFEKSRNIKNVI